MKETPITVLAIGDIFGPPGMKAIQSLLPDLRKTFDVDVVIANGENSSRGVGISARTAKEMIQSGVDIITTGNHIWSGVEKSDHLLQDNSNILRPANYPATNPGEDYGIFHNKGKRIGVINLMGRLFMNIALDCPFQKFEEIYNRHHREWDILIVDFHAEATSEKLAFAHFAADRCHLIFGTHTHIPTDDLEQISERCVYITDLGMTGPYDSVIGIDKDIALNSFLTGRRGKLKIGSNDVRLYGILVRFLLPGPRIEDFQKIQLFSLEK